MLNLRRLLCIIQYFFTDYKSDLTSYQEKDDTQGSFNDNDAKDNHSNKNNMNEELLKSVSYTHLYKATQLTI